MKQRKSKMTKPNLLKLARLFRKETQKNFGKKCRDYNMGCIVCNCHRVVDGLENLAELIGTLDDNIKLHEHKK